MMDHKDIKALICKELETMIDARIAEAEAAIAAALEARNNDTKSSAGDKYETGREMIQIEINKSETQRGKALMLKKDLARIDLHKHYTQSAFGSLVITNQEKYFLSIGFGKLQVEGETYVAISLASPIGMALQDKAIGAKVHFQGKELLILEIA
jgi:hypothetical protein